MGHRKMTVKKSEVRRLLEGIGAVWTIMLDSYIR